MRLKKLILLASLALVAGPSNGDSTIGSPDRTITQLSTYASHVVVFYGPESSSPPESCTGVNASIAASLDWTNNEERRNLMSALLAAFHAGSNVQLGVSGCSADGLPLITRVDVRP